MPKITLEFTYPQEETECRHAVNGGKAFGCLHEIRAVIRRHGKTDADPEKALKEIKELVLSTLAESGEE